MGQQPSTEYDRIIELSFLSTQTNRLLIRLIHSDRAVREAITHHYRELHKEQDAIWAMLGE